MRTRGNHVENPAIVPGFPFLERLAEVRARLAFVLESFARHGLRPVIAAELEFYLYGLNRERFPVVALQKLDAALAARGHALLPIQTERGNEQAECLLPPMPMTGLLKQLERLPGDIGECAAGIGMAADFTAKPKPEDYGSGLHLHVHLETLAEERIQWHCRDGQPDESLARMLGGLLHLMPAMPALLMPHGGFDRLQSQFDAPEAACWGMNNRSVALRLIDKGAGLHLEFRLPGADCPPALAMLALLAGMAEGLGHAHPLLPACYGRDEAWRVTLPKNMQEAKAAFAASPAMQHWAGSKISQVLLGEGSR